ncbi:hypothetical protein A3K86_22255 [Photobacterium jeanii]|uniref:GIY-YIG domain-containing protein n=1 Tax=Photobacterium jeanii TaxID=858640 RepID=A0A178K2Y3_9GAMM|nr:GIY-YIG nuclease family protein [Photobacterium jeanii]OAN11641.1 hypothetical protein A3K86_22255 [Photobacterium jeanii]PST91163.1 hypothetical protein C9I91_11365 [Photobacterium jeanii]
MSEQQSDLESSESSLNTEKLWYVYLIRTRSNSLYCGVTVDVERRFKQHQTGKQGAKSLKGKGPLTLAWSECIGNKRQAMQIEYRIKRLVKAKKEALIQGKWQVTSLLDSI